ncbi:MAG: rhomboid family intramembrane serine protease [Bacteroidales bacterium]|nr:rhomboid family intramembrane serine protease [Bacteroidales bacterium]
MYGFQQQGNTGDVLRRIFLSRTVLSRLVLINTAVYGLVKLAGLLTWLFAAADGSGQLLSFIGQWLALPSSSGTLLTRPWTLFTYMFLQEGFVHLLFNLLMLYFGGMVFLEYLSQKKLLWTYLMGGLAGGVFFILAFNLFPVFSGARDNAVALGASASVLAIIIAVATYVPDYTIHLFLFGRVKLKYIALVLIVIDVFSIQSNNPGGHIAHLGGALWGFTYAWYLKKGNDFYRIFDGIKFTGFERKSKYARFDTTRPKSGRPMNDDLYNEKRSATQHEIDRILDKISRSGYASLSSAEKELLFKTSNKK